MKPSLLLLISINEQGSKNEVAINVVFIFQFIFIHLFGPNCINYNCKNDDDDMIMRNLR